MTRAIHRSTTLKNRRLDDRLLLAIAGVLAAALSPAALAQAGAQDLASFSLEQLLDMEVTTASRFDQKIAHAPSAVQVIDAEEIRAHGWRTLAEALDSLPGLYLSDSGLYTYLGARGFLRSGDYDTRFLLMVNGHRINDPVYSQSPVGAEFPLDMSLVERIEYVPGPGSSVYGSNAFFGVINVLTREPQDGNGGEVRLTTGSHGLRDAQVTLSTKRPTGETLLSARSAHSKGRDLYFAEFSDTPSAGHVRGQDDERVRQLFVSHKTGDLSMQLLASDRRKEDPVAPYGQRFATPGAQVQDRWLEFGVKYDGTVDEATRWRAQMDLIDYRYLGDYVYGDGDPYLNRDIADGLSLVLGGQVVSTRFDGHTLLAGVEVQLDRAIEQRNFDVSPQVQYLRARHDMSSVGVFVEDEIAMTDALRFSAGLRVDRVDIGTVRLSPRLALTHTGEDGSTFKAIVGRAYRSPNAYERYYNVETPDGDQVANPSLTAENIQTAELHYGRTLGQRSRVELSVYEYRLRDLITLVADSQDVLTLENAAQASSRGGEIAIVHTAEGGTLVRASYAYSRVTDSETGRPVNAPRGIARVAATVPLAGDVSIAASAQHVGQRATRGGSVGAHAVVNANLLWQPAALPVSISAGWRNLFDERYSDPVGPEFAQDAVARRGREFRLECVWRF